VKPTMKRGLRAFFGVVSYYRKFMDKLAGHTTVLTLFTLKNEPPRVVWTESMEDAFSAIRKFLFHH